MIDRSADFCGLIETRKNQTIRSFYNNKCSSGRTATDLCGSTFSQRTQVVVGSISANPRPTGSGQTRLWANVSVSEGKGSLNVIRLCPRSPYPHPHRSVLYQLDFVWRDNGGTTASFKAAPLMSEFSLCHDIKCLQTRTRDAPSRSRLR